MDSYKLNLSKSLLCVCYYKVFIFEWSVGERKVIENSLMDFVNKNDLK